MPRQFIPPTYRKRLIRGREIAFVTLRDPETGRRRDYWLGAYGTPESRAAYARILAEWESRGRQLPDSRGPLRPADGVTTTQIVAAYWQHLQATKPGRQSAMTRTWLKSWRAHYGNIAAGQIGPVLLNGWRKAELIQHSVDWVARGTTAVLALYRWAVANELVPVDAYQRLKTVEPLRHMKRKRVLPAPDAAIAAARKLVGRQIGAMIDLQLVTGMRPGEVVVMRPCDIDMSGKVWLYRLDSHKTAYRGRERIVYLGPQAQETLRPFLRGRPTTAHCFSPVEAEAEWRLERRKARKTPLSCGNRPGTNRQDNPRRKPGAAYTTRTYGQAVERACQRASVTHWSPHQLRHNYATEVRRRYGLEAARILLGHCSALVTEAVYAERDQAAAMRIAAEIG